MSYFVLNPFRPHQTRASANVIRATMARTATSCAQILASVPQTGCVSVVLKGEEESTATNLAVLACLTPTAPGVAPVSLVSVSNIWCLFASLRPQGCLKALQHIITPGHCAI